MHERNGKIETVEHTQDQRPNVKPSVAVWNHCLEVAGKKGILPIEVLKEIVFYGEIVSQVTESEGNLGRIVWKKPDGSEIEIQEIGKKVNS